MSASLGLSPVLSPTLSPIWSGMLCPPRWSCLSLVCGLVSGLVCHLGWDAVRLAGLSPVLSPSLSPIWSGMLCPPPWSCFSLVSGLVSQLLSLFCLVACLSSGMLCLPPLGVSFSCLWSCLPACLGCCVRLLGSSPSPACLRSFVPSCFAAGLVCPCSGLVSKISCAICATVWGLRWCNLIERSDASRRGAQFLQCIGYVCRSHPAKHHFKKIPSSLGKPGGPFVHRKCVQSPFGQMDSKQDVCT